jgi:hypothetical protein
VASGDSHPGPAERETPRAELDLLLDRLSSGKRFWGRRGIPHRIRLLRQSIEGLLDVAPEWVRRALERRKIAPDSPAAGEEWISGPMTTIKNLQLFISALEDRGRPRPPALLKGPDDRSVARVLPRHPLDRFLAYNMSAEVWIQPGKPPSQGQIYRDREAGRPARESLALVLGAGNVSSIGPLDAAHKLFVENQVVLLKMNPVNAYLGPLFERAFGALIHEGLLAVAYGGAETGEYLCRHPAVDTIHLTGSGRTYEAIVWGADPDQRRKRRSESRRCVTKPFTAELGCVTPILVVPGPWTLAQLAFQANHVASMVAHNASFNCTAGKVLVTARGWPQRAEFLERVQAALAEIPARYAYYPGAQQRYRDFLDAYPRAVALGATEPGAVPWTWIPEVTAERGEYALTHEAFCAVLAEVTLEVDDAAEFLRRSVDFVNEDVWGTLSCVLLIDPETEADQRALFERAVANLRYGSVGVNAWTGVNFGLGVTSWGAYPGHTPEEIGSGCGAVHNSYLFDHPQKSVVYAPFRIWPKPVWFADHQNLRRLGRDMARYEAHHTPWNLARVALSGLRG